MSVVADELSGHLLPHGTEVVAIEVLLVARPLPELRHLALQVTQTVLTGLHGIIAQVFGLAARVVAVALAVPPPQAAVLLHAVLGKERFQETVVLIGVLGTKHGTVAPLDGPEVVVVDAWEDTLAVQSVLGLCHVVETCIVHDAGRMAVLLHPGLAAQGIHGHGAAGPEVVAQAEGVSHLVRGDEAYELPHEFLVVVHLAGSLIDAAGLYHVPVVYERHDIVVPADVALYDFTAAGVADMRAVGIGDGTGQVAYHAVAGILHAHGGVLGPLLAAYGILETGPLEGHLPVVDTLYEVLPPLLGRGGVDVVDDGLLGFHEFSAAHLLDILGTGLQPVACYVALGPDTLLLVVIVLVVVGEIAHAGVIVAGHHGFLGQEHEGDVETQGDAPRGPGGGQGGAGGGVGLGDAHLGVGGEGLDVLDVTVEHARQSELPLVAL